MARQPESCAMRSWETSWPADGAFCTLQRDAVVMDAARLCYAVAFGVTLTVCLGSCAKAVSTTSSKKAGMAKQLAAHMTPVAVAMLLCASGMAPHLRGVNGLRVNVLSLLAWSMMSWTMAELFARYALYSAGLDAGPDRRQALTMAAVSLLREGFAAAPRLWPDSASLSLCAVGVSLLLLVSVGAKVHAMSGYFASAAGETDRVMTSATLAAVIVAMAACDVVSLAYAAGAVSHTLLDSLLAVAIMVRALGLFSRLLVVMMYNDERTLNQHQLAEAGRRLQAEHDERLRRVYRYVCHELRVPLNSITLGLSLLLERQHTEDVDVLHAMQGAADLMLRVLCDFLDFSKMEQGAFRVQLHPVELRSLIQRAIDSMRLQADDAKVTLLSVLGADLPQWVYADGGRMVQACTNLVSNAIKFSLHDGSGVVTLSATVVGDKFGTQPDALAPTDASTPTARVAHNAADPSLLGGGTKRVRICCRDNGVGMASTDVPKLFQPFAQLDAGMLHAGRGTGLGLAIVKEIVEGHGGSVTVASSPGVGSTFVMDIPFRECIAATPLLTTILTTNAAPTQLPAASPAPPGAAAEAADDGNGDGNAPTASTNNAAVTPASSRPRAGQGAERALSPGTIGAEALVAAAASGGSGGTDATHAQEMVPHQVLARHQVLSEGVTWPRAVTVGGPHAVTTPTGANRQRAMRILVVDDETANRRLLAHALRTRTRWLNGAIVAVTEAASGLEALRVVDELGVAWFQVICMDNNMPHISGIDTVAALRAKGVTAVIIGCTGSALPEDTAAFRAAGLDDLIVKPINVDDLVAVMQQRCAARGMLSAAPQDSGAE